MSDAGDMMWDLDIDKQITFNVGYGASSLFRKLNSFEMFWHAEGIKTQYSGTVWLDGEEYEVIPEKSYGYADKNWGGDFTSPWLWISSCNITSLISGKKLNNSAFEAGGGRPKAFGIELPRKLLIGFYYEGKMYEYNFARFWNMVKIDFDFQEGEDVHTWHVNASNRNSRMELVLYCKRDEMMLFNYEAPDGKKRHNRLWNGGSGYGEIKLFKKDGTLKADFVHAHKVAERLERDELARMLLSGRHQVIKTVRIGGVWFKTKSDSLLTAAQVEAICKRFPDVRQLVPFGGAMIVDLKYIKDFDDIWDEDAGEKVSFIEFWGYDIQGAI
jgi:hypothetical protein